MLAPYASDPLSAQQSAERATRILTQPRNSNMSLSSVSVGSGGMGLTPSPALTPKSWSHTGGSSLGGAAGQMGTKVSRGGRAWVIAGVATLIVAAGAGGFVVATSMGKDVDTHAGAPNSLERTMSTDKDSAAAAVPAATPDPVKPTSPTVPPATPVTKPDTATAAGVGVKADPTATKKVDAKKPDTKTDAKSDATKTDTTKPKSTATKTKTKKPKGDDDLFDDRH
jgi:hypothetical protein